MTIPQEVKLDMSLPKMPELSDGPKGQKRVTDYIEKHPNEDVCIIAGPASGKTRLLTAATLSLIKIGVDPEEIAVVTFTTTARDTLRSRLRGSSVFIATNHSLGYNKSSKGRQDFKDSNYTKFDLLLQPWTPGEDKIFKWILCDECQDLSPKQFSSIKSRGKNHFFVGDPWQSIFTWAGADPNLLLEFSKTCKTFNILENHRSGTKIVSLADRFSKRKTIPVRSTEGTIEIGRPLNYNNLAILCRTNIGPKGVEEESRLLSSLDVPHTIVQRLGEDRKAYNVFKKSKKEVKKLEDYFPTQVMTIHLAKGGEWNRVLITYNCHNIGNSEVEKYVLYVGITRAENELYLDLSKSPICNKLEALELLD